MRLHLRPRITGLHELMLDHAMNSRLEHVGAGTRQLHVFKQKAFKAQGRQCGVDAEQVSALRLRSCP